MKTPWQVWVVGLVTLVWNAGGAWDYLMSETRNQSYLAMMPDDQRAEILAYLDAMPAWAVSTWALGVWGAVLASVLVLLRSRHAVTAVIVALVGFFGTLAYSYGLAPPSALNQVTAGTLAFNGAILLVLVALWAYARGQVARGVLR